MFVLPFVAMQKRSESVSVAANAQQLPHLPSLKYGIIGMPHVSINSVPELCDRESERERGGGVTDGRSVHPLSVRSSF